MTLTAGGINITPAHVLRHTPPGARGQGHEAGLVDIGQDLLLRHRNQVGPIDALRFRGRYRAAQPVRRKRQMVLPGPRLLVRDIGTRSESILELLAEEVADLTFGPFDCGMVLMGCGTVPEHLARLGPGEHRACSPCLRAERFFVPSADVVLQASHVSKTFHTGRAGLTRTRVSAVDDVTSPDVTAPVGNRTLTTEQVLTLLGLGRVWAAALEGELQEAGAQRPDGRWSVGEVRTWTRRVLASMHTLQPRHVRAVALRTFPVSASAIRRRAHVNVTQGDLDRWGLALALGYTHDHLPLHSGRAGDRLRREGYPPVTTPPARLRARVLGLWNQGLSRAQIRARCRIGETALTRALEAAQALPRLRAADINRRFGWSQDNIYQRLARGTFPPPDGHDGNVQWWWEPTVQGWEHGRGLIPCPTCGARVMRLRQHQVAHREA